MANPQTAVAVIADFEPRTIVELGKYDPTKYNVLIRGTSLVQTNPFLKPIVREITLDRPTDIYPITQRKQGDDWVATEVGISAVGLSNLASAASVQDIPQGSGRVDNGSDPTVVTYRATGAMRLPDGEWRVVTRECTIKLGTLAKEIRTQKTAKAEQTKSSRYPWTAEKLEAEIAKELLLKEKFMERLAETGAKNRVTTAILGLAKKYTPEEIRRPFVFAAVVPDMDQPDVRARVLDQATAAITGMFGPVSGQVAGAPKMLSAGPSADDVATADREPATELEPGELGGTSILPSNDAAFEEAPEGSTRSPRRIHVSPDGTQTVVEATAPKEPDWMAASMGTPAPAAPVQAAPAETDVAQLIRDTAAASGMKGKATPPQLARLGELLGGLRGTGSVTAALDFLWGEGASRALTGAQAQALANQADSVGAEEFLEQIRVLAERSKAAV